MALAYDVDDEPKCERCEGRGWIWVAVQRPVSFSPSDKPIKTMETARGERRMPIGASVTCKRHTSQAVGANDTCGAWVSFAEWPGYTPLPPKRFPAFRLLIIKLITSLARPIGHRNDTGTIVRRRGFPPETSPRYSS